MCSTEPISGQSGGAPDEPTQSGRLHISPQERIGNRLALAGLGCAVLSPVLVFTGAYKPIMARFGGLSMGLLPLATVALILAGLATAASGRQKRWQEAKKHRFLACVRCGYLLIDLPPTGVCPECRSVYDRERLPDQWNKLWGSPYPTRVGKFAQGIAAGEAHTRARRALVSPSRTMKSARIIQYAVGIVLLIALDAALRPTRPALLPALNGGVSLFFLELVVVLGVLAYGLEHRSRRRLRTFAADHGNRVCPRCHGSLVGLPDPGTCLKCGTPYTSEGLTAAWRNF